MYNQVWCPCKVFVLLIKPIVVLTFSLPAMSLDVKVPNCTFSTIFDLGEHYELQTNELPGFRVYLARLFFVLVGNSNFVTRLLVLMGKGPRSRRKAGENVRNTNTQRTEHNFRGSVVQWCTLLCHFWTCGCSVVAGLVRSIDLSRPAINFNTC